MGFKIENLAGIGLSGGSSRSTNKITVNPAGEDELSITDNLVNTIMLQVEGFERSSQIQRALFDQFPDLFNEAVDAADAADFNQSELDTVFESALRFGEADINRFRDEGLRSIRDTLAPSRGLRTTDSPILNAGAEVVREGQFQQGQLVQALRGDRARAGVDLSSQLRQQSFNNRLGLAFGSAQAGLSLGSAGNLNSIAQALSVIQEPRLLQATSKSSPSTLEKISTLAGGLGSLAGGLGALGFCHVAAEYLGWYTPEWYAARRWIMFEWPGVFGAAFRAVYRRHSQRIAGWVRRSRVVKAILRPVFTWAARKGERHVG